MESATAVRTDFAARLYDKLAGFHAGKNLFLSPFSIRVALAMCAAGAKGETRRVLVDLVGASEAVEGQNRHFAKLLNAIQGDGERPYQLLMANAMWGQPGYHFKPDFRNAIADCYDGAFHEVDFRDQPDAAVQTINHRGNGVLHRTRQPVTGAKGDQGRSSVPVLHSEPQDQHFAVFRACP